MFQYVGPEEINQAPMKKLMDGQMRYTGPVDKQIKPIKFHI